MYPSNGSRRRGRDVHGAFHVNVKRIGGAGADARRLSRYMVAQYCGGQNALVRLSQSRMEFPLTGLRGQLFKLIRGLPERYEFGNRLSQSLRGEQFTQAFAQFFHLHFRQAWADVLRGRSCSAYGVQFVVVGGRVLRL